MSVKGYPNGYNTCHEFDTMRACQYDGYKYGHKHNKLKARQLTNYKINKTHRTHQVDNRSAVAVRANVPICMFCVGGNDVRTRVQSAAQT